MAAFLIAPWGEVAKIVRGITMVIVIVFAITAMLALLALGVELVAISPVQESRLLGTALITSLLGWAFLDALGTLGRHLNGRKSKRERR